MHFLLDANMPGSVAEIFEAAGHACTSVRRTPLSDAADSQIAQYAIENGLTLITRDFDFADIRRYPPERFQGIVVLAVPDTADAATIRKLVESFLSVAECISHLPGRLAIVEFGRIRLRPAPVDPE